MNFLIALSVILILMVILWLISIPIKNVSIVDAFWGMGFVVVNATYFILEPLIFTRNIIVLLLVSIWGIRLSAYLFKRNYGKPEDFRYQEFRRHYGVNRYWWVSFFQVFILQGSLIMIVSLPLFGIHGETISNELNSIDYLALLCWSIGFLFESVGDYQLTKFKKNPANKGTILKTGLWRYTRHPNYFGDALFWWGIWCVSVTISLKALIVIFARALMTFLIVKISGADLLEKSLVKNRPGYQDYMAQTNRFIPKLC